MASREDHYAYNRGLLGYAKELRKDMTEAEVKLWRYVLRAGKMRGFTFRRQRPVLHFIADFICSPLMLIIELDGPEHFRVDKVAYDKRRTALLEAEGFRVVRFTDVEVFHQLSKVRNVIELIVDEQAFITGGRPRRERRPRRDP